MRSISALLISLLIVAPAEATVKYQNTVHVRWKAVAGAKSYGVQLRKGEKTVVDRQLAAASVDVELEPGRYSLRIRTYDSAGREGPWSTAREIVIKPGPPLPLENQPKEVAVKAGAGTETAGWERADFATAYKLRLLHDGKVMEEREVAGASFEFKIPEPGKYSYVLASVYEGVTGDFGPAFELEAIEFRLGAPKGLRTGGRVKLGEGDRLKLSWDKVDGADAYEVRVIQQKKWKISASVGDAGGGADAGKAAPAKKWKSAFHIEGADAVDVEPRPAQIAVETRAPAAMAAPFQPVTTVTRENSISIEAPPEGSYTVKVRALAGMDSDGKVSSRRTLGPETKGDVELLK